MANDDTPLTWKLVALDPSTQEKTTVDENASYGDYIKSIGGNLFYLKQNGKVRDIYRYSSDTDSSQKITGGPSSPNANLSRKEIDVAGVHGALIEPPSASGKTLPLIIWMHGGPQRQTSIGYHPYLSYGVYDELLENMAQQGARVFKIDYTGSWGYGKTFIDALRDQVGVREMADIKNSIEALKKQYATSDVFLIGNSYGGYTALKGATDFPSLVDGTVAIAPVTDWFTLIYEIPGSPFTQQFGGQPTDPLTQAKYRAASIIKDLQKIDSDPVVLVYGENDTTVPPRQSRQFLTVASSIGKNNVEGVELKGEDHVIKYRESLELLCETTADAFGFDGAMCE
jgi:dipeptidyl aminopeptidase/acylaminoacyl peptidase